MAGEPGCGMGAGVPSAGGFWTAVGMTGADAGSLNIGGCVGTAGPAADEGDGAGCPKAAPAPIRSMATALSCLGFMDILMIGERSPRRFLRCKRSDTDKDSSWNNRHFGHPRMSSPQRKQGKSKPAAQARENLVD
jgi:hypothetical protein